MPLRFTGEIWYWRGPSPFHFVTVPEPEATELHDMSRDVSYGWGMIPVTATIGRTTWSTSLFPKDGGYLLPVKDKVRATEHLDVGDTAGVRMEVTTRARPGR